MLQNFLGSWNRSHCWRLDQRARQTRRGPGKHVDNIVRWARARDDMKEIDSFARPRLSFFSNDDQRSTRVTCQLQTRTPTFRRPGWIHRAQLDYYKQLVNKVDEKEKQTKKRPMDSWPVSDRLGRPIFESGVKIAEGSSFSSPTHSFAI